MTASPENYTPEKYLSLRQEYIRQADEELLREDYRQTGEKAWGAVSTAIKCISEQRGWNHRHHRLTGDALRKLADEFDQEHLKYWFHTAESLHNNFYEDSWTEAEVAGGIKRIKDLLQASDVLRHQPPGTIPNRSNNQKRRWEALNGVSWDDAHPPV